VQRIIAVDVSPMRLAVAAQGGAHLTLDASKVDVFEEICRDLGETSSAYHPRSSRAGSVFECSGAAKAMESTLDIVRPAGTVLFVALIGHKIEFDIDKVVQKEIRVQGSFAYRREDVRQAFEALSTREVDARPLVTHEIPLGQLTAAFEKQLDRDASIKVVIRPDVDPDQADVSDASVEVQLNLAHAAR
jgi:threonine dehydrogenase-like Zn-dependent dehydrogenase